jgi:putative membrane protein
MLWVKALHVIFVASWFSTLFYLPRIFVNLADVAPDSHAERERLLLMARRLHRFGSGLMHVAILLGLVLWLYYGAGGGQSWLYAKLVVVASAIGYHHYCRRLLRGFEVGSNRRSARWLRVFNEAAIVLFALIVVLAVVKPFTGVS